MPLLTLMSRMAQAELLTAFGGCPPLERKAALLGAVEEDAEPADLASARLPNGNGPIHPVAEHHPASSLTSTQDLYLPGAATQAPGASRPRQQALGASILAWPSASTPHLSPVRRYLRD